MAGRPPGTGKYTDAMFLDILGANPLTTTEICEELQSRSGFPVNWNTGAKYLKRLKEQGRVKHRKVGKVNLWSI